MKWLTSWGYIIAGAMGIALFIVVASLGYKVQAGLFMRTLILSLVSIAALLRGYRNLRKSIEEAKNGNTKR